MIAKTKDKKPLKAQKKEAETPKHRSYSQQTVRLAKTLFLQGHTMAEIKSALGLPNTKTLYNWSDKYKWSDQVVTDDPALSTSRRYLLLLNKENKTGGEIQEMEACSRQMINFAKIKAIENGVSVHGNSKGGTSNGNSKGKRGRKKKNDTSQITQQDFDRVAAELLYKHQEVWRAAGKDEATRYDRLILKARQIGATFYFAFEAFESACMTGENQIFLSATRDQAEIFKAYMCVIAKEYFDIELSGNPITLSNNAMCYFLSANSVAAQSRAGNVYFDEMFWVRDWEKMLDLGGAMATQGYKITGFSTPSALSHPACKYWDGRRYNAELTEKEQVKIDLKRKLLKQGNKGGDGVWRNLVTLKDAIDQGFDRTPMELVKRRNPPSVFRNLYDCHFVDDSASVFKLQEILACAVDPIIWEPQFNRHADKPYGTNPVTVGYDPAGDGDDASAILMSLPETNKDPFRLFEKETMQGISSYDQSQVIREWYDKYNFEYMELDATGPGYFVHEHIEPFFPAVETIQYTPEVKQAMIYKAKDVFRTKRFQYDENDTTIPLAFMTVRQTLTEKTRKITYISSRSDEVGHGDAAWATMHGFMAEPLNMEELNDNSSSVAFSH